MAVAEVSVEPEQTSAWDGVAKARSVWRGMRSRCADTDAARRNFPRYAGRGIRVCASWNARDGFPRFLSDIGPRPEGHEIDRSDNDGNYSCGHCDECRANGWLANCRWVTRSRNCRNRSNTVYVDRGGRRMPMLDLLDAELEAHRAPIADVHLVYQRMGVLGWAPERALSERRHVGWREGGKHLLDLWRDCQTLYELAFDEKETRVLMRQLVGRFGPVREVDDVRSRSTWEEAEPCTTPPGSQRNAYIWGLTPPPEGHAYECGDCARLFSIGFGCALCMGAVCAACFEAESHVCAHDVHRSRSDSVRREGDSLESIGASFGFTREYARQIERGALAKLRRTFAGAVPPPARVEGDLSNAWGAYE